MAPRKGNIIPLKEVRRFVSEAMESVGTPRVHAAAMADLLVAADYRGHLSHGLNRLEMYVRDVSSKSTDAEATPKILKEKAAVALVDGNNGLGPVVGNYCMDLAMKKARDTGVGWVSARGSNHYGIAGWYALRAIEKGFLGMSFTNTSPLLSPTRCKEAALGTNPIAVAARAKDDSFVLDMATTAVALGKIELQQRKKVPMPLGWAQNKQGHLTRNPDEALEAYCLSPLGGAEETSGYKGTGLAIMVELFCGILSGAKYGPFIRKWSNTSEVADLGQCFIALDPSAFAPGFEQRLVHLLETIRQMKQVDPHKPVLIPGDPEKNHMKMVNQKGGIEYHENQIEASVKLAADLKISPMKTLYQ